MNRNYSRYKKFHVLNRFNHDPFNPFSVVSTPVSVARILLKSMVQVPPGSVECTLETVIPMAAVAVLVRVAVYFAAVCNLG